MQNFKQHTEGQNASLDEVSLTISAWMDGDEIDLPSKLLDSEHGIEKWKLYHLIGDTLRTPELAIRHGDALVSRVHDAVAAEPAIIAIPKTKLREVSPSQRNQHWFRRFGLPGLAVAAAVASVVWVARPLIVPEMNNGSPQMASTSATNVMASNADTPEVRDYVTAHRTMSGPSAVRQVSFGTSR